MADLRPADDKLPQQIPLNHCCIYRLARKYSIESLVAECEMVLSEMQYDWDLVMTVLPALQAMSCHQRMSGAHVSIPSAFIIRRG